MTEGKKYVKIDNTTDKAEIVADSDNNLTVSGTDSDIYAYLTCMTENVTDGNTDLAAAVPTADYSEYELVWNDEFNGNALDSSVWGNFSGNPQKRWSVFQFGNTAGLTEETDGKVLQPDAEGVVVKDGVADISVECSDTVNYRDATYTNRQPVTEGRLYYRYGLYEIRAKLPKFPAGVALWSTGSGLEIDLAEGRQYAGADGYYFSANVHIPAPSGNGRRVAHSYSKYSSRTFRTNEDLTEGFHNYSVLWTPDILEFAVDGEVFWTLDLHEFDVCNTMSDATQMLLLGASYCSTANGGGYLCDAKTIDNFVKGGGTLPQKTSLVVDYVRLYQSRNYGTDNKNQNVKGNNYFKIG